MEKQRKQNEYIEIYKNIPWKEWKNWVNYLGGGLSSPSASHLKMFFSSVHILSAQNMFQCVFNFMFSRGYNYI